MSCVAELVRLGEHSATFAERKIHVVVLSTDDAETMKRGRDRFALPFSFVADPDAEIAKRLGLLHEHGGPRGKGIYFATSLLLDSRAIVRWKHIATDVRDRATPEQMLDAARSR